MSGLIESKCTVLSAINEQLYVLHYANTAHSSGFSKTHKNINSFLLLLKYNLDFHS